MKKCFIFALALMLCASFPALAFTKASDYMEVVSEGEYFIVTPSGLNISTSTNKVEYKEGKGIEVVATLDLGDRNGGMLGYVSYGKGGYKKNGTWNSDKHDGLPVKLSDLTDSVKLTWMTSQENAWDDGDKWMASFNAIFSTSGKDVQPVSADRDFDMVIMGQSHNFGSAEIKDQLKPRNSDGSFWYYARNSEGNPATMSVTVDDSDYEYAVRFKCWDQTKGAESKRDKIHVKFIPTDEPAPYLDHPIKDFVDFAKEHYDDVDTSDKGDYKSAFEGCRDRANENMTDDALYLKSVNAGYEVYKGKYTLKTLFFE